MVFWIESAVGNTEKCKDTAEGLEALVKYPFASGEAKIHLDLDPLSEPEKINFIAFLQKSWKHIAFMLGLPSVPPVSAPKIWQRYWKNGCDNDHNEGVEFDVLVSRYLDERFPFRIAWDHGVIILKGEFENIRVAGALVGRLVNAARWCLNNTATIHLQSSTPLKFKTFTEITLKQTQPVVRRKVRR